jgi:predicted transport protein
VLEYQIEGDYVVFESSELSDFVFVYEMGSILWVIIVLGVIALFEMIFLVYVSKKNKQLKSKKLMSAYPPFLFGMFIAEWEIVLVIILAVAVIALAIISILFATKVINSRTKVSTKEEEVAVVEESNNQTIEDVEVDEKDVSTPKSFLERLENCSAETIAYYNDIKNELLSYKKVKSKISFKHESFRVGMPIVARLKIRRKSLYLFLALDPNEYLDTKYKIKDMSVIGNYKDVPTMYKINLPRRAVYAKELIKDLMEKFNTEKNND